MSDLIKELEAVVNRYSVENESDTPDFLLATLLSETLKTWAKVVKARDDWYGFKPWPEATALAAPSKKPKEEIIDLKKQKEEEITKALANAPKKEVEDV